MHRMPFAVVLAASAGLTGWWSPREILTPVPVVAAAQSDRAADGPPSPWLQADPADSLYRAAREALNRRDFLLAAGLFASLPGRFPGSGYAPDAYYWQAFALYRLGGEARLRDALAALRTQSATFPEAATRGDARALEQRIQGELARRGDSEAAAEVAEAAAKAAEAVAAVEAVEAVEAVGARDGCAEDDTRLAALSALIHMNADRARPVLTRVLARRDGGSACLRRKA
ncbi:MAG TPA: hypothetical protein VMN37_12375, partial [Gemmatimonadales bacterium]|nr:hypothetical protein [Gemmatimonadales bacterium]